MADVNKPKLQLRSGLSFNGEKTPSPATKLLINHGKPNFTIQRSPKAQNGNANPLSPTPTAAQAIVNNNVNNNNNNNNEFVVKSTTFNGVFKPSNISAATKQTLQQQNGTNDNNDNEAAKVVLRRAKVVQAEMREPEDDENVPEFIRRQRRIQERLANQNILDFENRRSGYFTQVLISPSTPNRQSFVETMASPAVKPGLEMPAPPVQQDDIQEETAAEQLEHGQQLEVEKSEEPVTLNGQDEEEEVAKAIEEVNKAVEGEDEDKTEMEDHNENLSEESKESIQTPAMVAVTYSEQVEEIKPQEETQLEELTPVVAEVTEATEEKETSKEEVLELTAAQQNGHIEVADSTPATTEDPKCNGITEEEHLQNGNANNSEFTISHTNGLNGPSLPSPDPKGEKGVNFEPKTIVSFSQELGNDVNKYPDTIKVVKDVESSEAEKELQELTKLKFEIKGDDKDIEVKPVLVTETA